MSKKLSSLSYGEKKVLVSNFDKARRQQISDFTLEIAKKNDPEKLYLGATDRYEACLQQKLSGTDLAQAFYGAQIMTKRFMEIADQSDPRRPDLVSLQGDAFRLVRNDRISDSQNFLRVLREYGETVAVNSEDPDPTFK